jgi:hypothetical protein
LLAGSSGWSIRNEPPPFDRLPVTTTSPKKNPARPLGAPSAPLPAKAIMPSPPPRTSAYSIAALGYHAVTGCRRVVITAKAVYADAVSGTGPTKSQHSDTASADAVYAGAYRTLAENSRAAGFVLATGGWC